MNAKTILVNGVSKVASIMVWALTFFGVIGLTMVASTWLFFGLNEALSFAGVPNIPLEVCAIAVLVASVSAGIWSIVTPIDAY